ncbi:MAG: SigE family RNA polymerase sigma factor [Pseudonocardiales bacterium]
MNSVAVERGEGALSGETKLSEFAAEHSVALTRFAYLLCGDHQLAEDLVQDAFVALYRRFGETMTIAAPVAYARRVIVNGQISRARKRSSHETITDQVPESSTPAGDSGEQDAMWQALALLPGRQRAVLVMRFYLGLPEAEIASALDCRAGTVRSLAARAFVALRAHPALRGVRSEEAR